MASSDNASLKRKDATDSGDSGSELAQQSAAVAHEYHALYDSLLSQPPSKRTQLGEGAAEPAPSEANHQITATFKSATGEVAGPTLRLPTHITPNQLNIILNQLLENVSVFLFIVSRVQ